MLHSGERGNDKPAVRVEATWSIWAQQSNVSRAIHNMDMATKQGRNLILNAIINEMFTV